MSDEYHASFPGINLCDPFNPVFGLVLYSQNVYEWVSVWVPCPEKGVCIVGLGEMRRLAWCGDRLRWVF